MMTMVVDHPTSAIQLAGHTTSAVVEGLTTRNPWMLGILLLNVAAMAAAVYFLRILILGQQGHLAQVLDVQQAEVRQILETHNREFDALTHMVQNMLDTAAAAAAVRPPPPTVAPDIPPELPPEPPPKKGR